MLKMPPNEKSKKRKILEISSVIGILLTLLDYIFKFFPWPLLINSIGLFVSPVIVISVYHYMKSSKPSLKRKIMKYCVWGAFLIPLFFLFSLVCLALFNLHYVDFPDGKEIELLGKETELQVTVGLSTYTIKLPYRDILKTAHKTGKLPQRLRVTFTEVSDVQLDPGTCDPKSFSRHRDDKALDDITIRFFDLISADGCKLTIYPLKGKRPLVKTQYTQISCFQEVAEWFGKKYYKR